jgi:hypothetical protein
MDVYFSNKEHSIGFEDIAEVVTKIFIFWNIMTCSFWKLTDFSEENTTSIFGVKECAKQACLLPSSCFLLVFALITL